MSFYNPHFAEPVWLWLAILGPVLLFALQRYSAAMRRRQLSLFAAPDRLAALTASYSPARRILKEILLLISLAAIGLTLARPQWGERRDTAHLLGEDMLFILDCSRSMLATDVTPNRLERSKLAIMEYVQSRGQGRVGLVAFAGQAFLQCPLTFDYYAFQDAVQAVDDKTIPVAGTDIGRALDEGFRAMDKSDRRKLLVLLTDGEDLEKGGVKWAEKLKNEGLVVFTVGVGTPAGAEITLINEQGQATLLRDRSGQVVRSRLDEPTLTKIAQTTHGQYFPLGPLGEGLAKVRVAMEHMDPNAGSAPASKMGVDRFYVPLTVALLCMVLESLVGTRKRSPGNRRQGTTLRSSVGSARSERSAIASASIVLLLPLLACFGPWDCSAGTTGQAMDRASQLSPETPRDYYNAGTKLLKEGRLRESELFLETAVGAQVEALQPEALFNLGHVRFAQGLDELKKGPPSSEALDKGSRATAIGDASLQDIEQALRSTELAKLTSSYIRGRGARKQVKEAATAVKRALEAHKSTLLKWQRSSGDFHSSVELSGPPKGKDAQHNADVVDQHIAKLIDSIRELQQMASALGKQNEELRQKLKQLKGMIPQQDMPPGSSGEDDEDDDEEQPKPQSGDKEAANKQGQELQLTPEQASWLLDGFRLDREKQLPMGQEQQTDPKDPRKPNW